MRPPWTVMSLYRYAAGKNSYVWSVPRLNVSPTPSEMMPSVAVFWFRMTSARAMVCTAVSSVVPAFASLPELSTYTVNDDTGGCM